MSQNDNYWKDRYQQTWEQSTKKEERAKGMLEQVFHHPVEYFGTGAGSTEYLSGSAQKNGSEKGAPDLHLTDSSLYFEVTGPFSKRTQVQDDLWVRKDKLQYAQNHFREQQEFLLHYLPSQNLWRTIYFNEAFFHDASIHRPRQEDYLDVYPRIRGTREHYIAIHANNPFILSWDQFLTQVQPLLPTPTQIWRSQLHMTQQAFADSFHIPLRTLQDWEHRRRTPPDYVYDLIEQILRYQGKL